MFYYLFDKYYSPDIISLLTVLWHHLKANFLQWKARSSHILSYSIRKQNVKVLLVSMDILTFKYTCVIWQSYDEVLQAIVV